MDDDPNKRGDGTMQQPAVRVRERVRPTEVQSIARPQVRVRERPAPAPAPKVRVRERVPVKLQPDAYDLPPGLKQINNELHEWRRGTRAKNQEPPRAIPDQWENGSAIMRGPQSAGYRRYPHVMGEPEEKNPNLMGRTERVGDGYHLWRWTAMRYVYVGKFKDMGEIFAALRK